MAEPIIYRGFVLDENCDTKIQIGDQILTGLWVQGTYIKTPQNSEGDVEHYIIQHESCRNCGGKFNFYKVVPETVCRLLYESKSVGIVYEKDIIRTRIENAFGKTTFVSAEVLYDEKANLAMIKVGARKPVPVLLSDSTVLGVSGNIFNGQKINKIDPDLDRIVEAEIISQHFEDERGLTHFVDLMTEDNKYISFGGIHLYGNATYDWMKRLIEIIGKGSTAHCEGVRVRVKMVDGKVVAIGSINYDIWLDLRDFNASKETSI